ncbi:MAG: SRPBCC family protein [Ferruginibacter sp.]
MSKTYRFMRQQVLPATLPEVWEFFSSPANLAKITPAHLGFKILSAPHGDDMYAGQLIEYTVKPIMNIPLYWMTEITQVKQHEFFIDEQRFGPYSFWHHQHHFKETANGTEMRDMVHYRVPGWILGDLANELLVKDQLKKIFDYRYKAAEERFKG